MSAGDNFTLTLSAKEKEEISGVVVHLSVLFSNSLASTLIDWDDFLKQNVSAYQTKPSGPEPG